MSRTALAGRPSTSAPGDGSRTITITNDPTKEEGDDDDRERPDGEGPSVPTLRLRGARTREAPKVTWDEDVVDNEGMGKKKSKICCIFHPTREFGESSGSDSDSDSDDSSCDGHNHDRDRAQPSGGSNSNQAQPGPSSKVHECCSSDDEKNAYERMPKHKKKGKHRAA
ncbi:type 1 phosphatases regulator YPI1 [Coprinopsis sp. MPI-PUGE-AT-0042]|nr:type 1 phosphatases regulator YPI1 [Coprinopsis sp. MPI-PUGE-AT-0042]